MMSTALLDGPEGVRPENSKILRVSSCVLSLVTIAAACVFLNVTVAGSFLYIWGTLTGSYISYYYRNTNSKLAKWVTGVGVLIVIGTFLDEVIHQWMSGSVSAFVPFSRVLCGLLALHTFELKSRADINNAALVAVGLFCCVSTLGASSAFGFIAFLFVLSGTAFFYWESVARTKDASSTPGEEALRAVARDNRAATSGSALFTLALLPLATMGIFLIIPKTGSMVDWLTMSISKMRQGEPLEPISISPGGAFRLANAGKGMGGISIPGVYSPTSPLKSAYPLATSGTSTSTQAGSGAISGSTGPNSQHTAPGGKGKTASNENGAPQQLEANSNGAISTALMGTQPGTAKGTGSQNAKDGRTGNGAASENGHGGPVATKNQTKPNSGFTEAELDKKLIYRSEESSKYDDELCFSVTTSRATYYKRTAFDHYDGKEWTQKNRGALAKCRKLAGQDEELGGVDSLFIPKKVHTEKIRQGITVGQTLGRYIPAAYIPQQIEYPSEPVIVDKFGALESPRPVGSGVRYTVTAAIPDYDIDAINGDHTEPTAAEKSMLTDYLELPTSISPKVIDLAKSTAGNGTIGERASKLCTYLRKNYTYSLNYKPDKNPAEMSEEFLFNRKEGACGQFATTFIVMCRAAGVPARIVTGFSPGDAQSGVMLVKAKHAHAWAEVYCPGYNWVPFDATPKGLLPQPEKKSFWENLKSTLGMSPREEEQRPNADTSKMSGETFDSERIRKPAQPDAGAVNSGTTGTDSKDPSSGKGSASGTSSQNKNATKSSDTELPRIDKPNKTTDKDGKSSTQTKTEQKTEKKISNNLAFFLDWHRAIWIIVIIPACVLVVRTLRSALSQLAMEDKLRKADGPQKPATILFLKVADDLKKIKVSRHFSDTPEELLARFADASAMGVSVHPELELLCKRFMELYAADRFGCDDAAELRAEQMRKIGEQIHSLVRTKAPDIKAAAN